MSEKNHHGVVTTSLFNLAAMLFLLRLGGMIRVPWWIVLAPLWIIPAAVAIVVVVAVILIGAWAIDELGGARELARRPRTTDQDWARWH